MLALRTTRTAAWTAALLLVVALAQGSRAAQPAADAPFDIVIRNGRVIDGMGNPWRRADIAVRGGRVVAVGRVEGPATRTIDATGQFVTPGFIDVHSHAAEGLAEGLHHAQPLLAQGITTAVLNPDGGGPADLAAQRARYEKTGLGVNAALFVPHGGVRQVVLGMDDRAPSGPELARMADLVRAGMKAGGIGLSSGPYYAPGSYAKTDEFVALSKVAAEFGGVYSSHIRDEGDYTVGVVAAVQEVIDIAEQAGLPGIVTHMKALGVASWGLSVAASTRIDRARERGVEVYADQYAYEASGTGIVGALVPRWALVGGRTQLMERIKGSLRPKLAAEIRTNVARRGGGEALVVSRYEPNPSYEGRTLGSIAKERNRPIEELALDLLIEGDASLVSFNMSEADIEHIMKQPYTMTCTDGTLVPMNEGKPHPRAYGAFPRKLRLYVRERGVVDWAFAIRSMTSLPATVFGMKDRGVIREGAWADLLVFDPAKVADTATYTDPHQLAVGMTYVLVNGVPTRDKDQPTQALPGKVVVPERR
jgi:N-acyl-D-amino-acid deacylase